VAFIHRAFLPCTLIPWFCAYLAAVRNTKATQQVTEAASLQGPELSPSEDEHKRDQLEIRHLERVFWTLGWEQKVVISPFTCKQNINCLSKVLDTSFRATGEYFISRNQLWSVFFYSMVRRDKLAEYFFVRDLFLELPFLPTHGAQLLGLLL